MEQPAIRPFRTDRQALQRGVRRSRRPRYPRTLHETDSVRHLISLIVRVFFRRVVITGAEHVPRTGPALSCSF